jgi:replicative DNA helicase
MIAPSLPANVEAEMSLLGAILLNPEIVDEVFDVIKEVDFSDERLRVIFRVIHRMWQEEKAMDVLVLRDELRSAQVFDRVGGAEMIASLQSRVPTSANYSEYIRILHQKGVLRQVMHAAQQIIDKSCSADVEAGAILDLAESRIFEITDERLPGKGFRIGDLFEPILEIITEGQRKNGLYTGFEGLDQLTNGFDKGQMIIIAGRPGVGKTTFALNIIERVAVQQGKPVGIFSLEMDAQQIAKSILLMHSRVNADSLNKGHLSKQEHSLLTMGMDRLRDVPIIIDDTPEPSIMHIRSRARRLCRRHNLSLIVIDYLQLLQMGDMGGSDRQVRSRENEIAFISRHIKLLAKDLGVPVIAISQLNRQVDSRTDQKPRLSDLRESGAIEQDADLVILMSRQDYYGTAQDSVTADLDVAKNRTGPTGEFQLIYEKKMFHFDNASTRQESEAE